MIARASRSSLLCFVVVCVAGAAPPAFAAKGSAPPALTKPLPPQPDGWTLKGTAAKGKGTFKTYCQKCHGAGGEGDGLAGEDLNPKPRDFTNPGMKERTDWTLYNGVRFGGPKLGLSEKMTAWKDVLTDQEIRDVIAYVRQFAH